MSEMTLVVRDGTHATIVIPPPTRITVDTGRGPQGPSGPQGDQGETGETGSQGPAGTPGAPGSDGEAGPAGSPGEDGAPGADGAPGEKGDTGDTGPEGPKGDTGDTGAPGADGPEGPAGPTGDPGTKGDTGDTGPAGADGVGVPVGGTTDQILAKIDETDFNTEWVDPPTGASSASETVEGVVELATQAETNTGTDDVRVITPLKLQTRLSAYAQPLDSDLTSIAALSTTSYGRALLELANQAALMGLLISSSETAEGKIEIATQSETNTGTDDVRAVTPLKLQTRMAAYVAATAQPLDSDLTSIAALSTTSYGRAFLELANQAALMALLSASSETASGIIEIATQGETNTGTDDVRAVTPLKFQTRLAAYAQPLDSDLTALAALSTTSYGRAFLELANQAALMGLLSASSTTAQGIVELATSAETTTGTDAVRATTPAGVAAALAAFGAGYQPIDSDLTSIAALTTTSFGRTFLDLADVAAARTKLGLGTAAVLNTGTASGDIPLLGASGLLAPARMGANTADSSKFLRGDQAWVTLPPDVEFSVQGVLTVTAYTFRWYASRTMTITGVRASVGTVPTGASIIVDVQKNGTSIFATTTANRPTIAASGNTATSGAPDTTALVLGDYLTVSVLQIGSTIAGSDLTVQVY